MFTADHARELFAALREIKNPENQVLPAEGYDGVIALLQDETLQFPFFVVEDNDQGVLRVDPSGFDRYTLAIWVLFQVEQNQSRTEYLRRAKQLLVKAVALLTEARLNGYPELQPLDLTEISYSKRQAGNSFVGYEALLLFEEHIDICNYE